MFQLWSFIQVHKFCLDRTLRWWMFVFMSPFFDSHMFTNHCRVFLDKLYSFVCSQRWTMFQVCNSFFLLYCYIWALTLGTQYQYLEISTCILLDCCNVAKMNSPCFYIHKQYFSFLYLILDTQFNVLSSGLRLIYLMTAFPFYTTVFFPICLLLLSMLLLSLWSFLWWNFFLLRTLTMPALSL